jgi:hypothetical protein
LLICFIVVQTQRDELSPQQIQQVHQLGFESVIDRNQARQDADDLYRAGVGKWGTDEKTFNAIFSRRSYYQLRAMFEEYQKVKCNDLPSNIDQSIYGELFMFLEIQARYSASDPIGILWRCQRCISSSHTLYSRSSEFFR